MDARDNAFGERAEHTLGQGEQDGVVGSFCYLGAQDRYEQDYARKQ